MVDDAHTWVARKEHRTKQEEILGAFETILALMTPGDSITIQSGGHHVRVIFLTTRAYEVLDSSNEGSIIDDYTLEDAANWLTTVLE